jgi:hypothetical protein
MRTLTAALLLMLAAPAAAQDCPLQTMTMPQIGNSIRAARSNIAGAIAAIENPPLDQSERERDTAKTNQLLAKLRQSLGRVDGLLKCQEFK